ncbi:MAG: hypothetical protein AAF399_20855 [Bacteroidota bacterium]
MKLLSYVSIVLFVFAFGCRSTETSALPSSDFEAVSGSHAAASQLESVDFGWFWELLVEGIELSPELIQEHTLLAHAYGNFRGESAWQVNDQIQAVILKQESSLCTSFFLLTTDGKRIIDQRLLGENCQPGPAQTQQYASKVSWKGTDRLEVTELNHSLLPEKTAIDLQRYAFLIAGNGEVERCHLKE